VEAVLAVLRVSSDNDVLTALSVLLGERPSLLQQLPSLIGEPAQEQMERLVGVIKSFDNAKGFGFIQCDETFHVHQRDVFLSDKQLVEGAMVGAMVSFEVTLNKQGHPQAQNLAPAFVEPMVPEPVRPPQHRKQPSLQPSQRPPAGPGHFIGTVKKFDRAKRFGFIECTELFQQFGRDVFLSDVQIGNFDNGSVVAFQMTLNQQGFPQAQDLQEADASAFDAPPAGRPAKRQRGSPMPGVTRHVGVIKKFQADKHHGFIECEELQHYGFDVFLSDKQIGEFQNGSHVSFGFQLKNGRPQALDLEPA